jgi:hypothetical protein
LADSSIDTEELRKDAAELNAVRHRVEWLADMDAA